jgi:AcrR family transcriptional regulator
MPRIGLDKAAVVEAAAVIANRDGLPAVTLARLAQDLTVKTPSLYNHVQSLGALHRELALKGMIESNAVMARAAIGKARSDAVVAIGLAYRRFALDSPGLYAASLLPPPRGDVELEAAATEAVGTVIAVLGGFGLVGDDALHATRGLRAIIHGFVGLESAGAFGLALDTEESFRRLLKAFCDGLGKG